MNPHVTLLESRRLLSTTFYVSTAGNDASPTPTSVATPLRTLQMAADLARPGDRVLVMGGTYHETVGPARSGTLGNPITFAPYDGQTVIIDGADPLTGWVDNGNGTWSAALPPAAGTDPNHTLLAPQFFQNGTALTDARWPGPGTDVFGTGGFATATAGTAAGVIDDPNLTAGWTGGFVHFTGSLQYVWQTEQVTGSVAGQVTFTNPASATPNYLPEVGMPFYLTDAPPALAAIQPGEWYIDPATDIVTIDPIGGVAPGNTVEIKTRNDAFDLTGRSFIHVTGFHLQASTIVTSATSNSDVITGISARYVSQFQNFIGNPFTTHAYSTGILLDGTNDTVRNSLIDFSAGNGIVVAGNRDTAVGNTVQNTDYAGTDSSGIEIIGNGQTVVHNTITTTGRNGILGRGNGAHEFFNNRIAYNDISQSGVITHDLGGIYIGVVPSNGTLIDHNWIHDTASVRQAVNADLTVVGGSGIYLDQGASHIRIIRNVVWDTQESSIIVNRSDVDWKNAAGQVIQPAGSDIGDLVLYNTVVPKGPGGGSGNGIGVFADNAAGTVVRGNLLDGGPVTVGGAPNLGSTIVGNLVATAMPPNPGHRPLATRLVPAVAQAGAYRPGQLAWTAGAG